MRRPYLSSSRLFTDPSFAKGTARIGDFFGTLDEYNYDGSEQEADTKALCRDWAVVGSDIDHVLTTYGTTKEPGADR